MAQWDDGYVTDVAYTSNFYREITPSWLAMTSLLLGHRPPDLAKPFSYADLGCGNGFTALIVAATSRAAEYLKLDKIGVLAAGKEADFLVLDGNPLDNITNTQRISRIYIKGAEVDRAMLRAGLRQ